MEGPADVLVPDLASAHQSGSHSEAVAPETPCTVLHATNWPNVHDGSYHSTDEIIATQGNCLTLGYESPAVWYVSDSASPDFMEELVMALRLLSERRSPRYEIYGDEADESRLGHTPPETRARFNTARHERLRHYIRHQMPSTPGDTPPETPELVQGSSDISSESSPQTAKNIDLTEKDQPLQGPLMGINKDCDMVEEMCVVQESNQETIDAKVGSTGKEAETEVFVGG